MLHDVYLAKVVLPHGGERPQHMANIVTLRLSQVGKIHIFESERPLRLVVLRVPLFTVNCGGAVVVFEDYFE